MLAGRVEGMPAAWVSSSATTAQRCPGGTFVAGHAGRERTKLALGLCQRAQWPAIRDNTQAARA
jgi:hypothetical protein